MRTQQPTFFDVLDPNLPHLANAAATELNHLANGRKAAVERKENLSAHVLAKMLTCVQYKNSLQLEVLRRAFNDSHENEPIRKSAGVLPAIELLAERMKRAGIDAELGFYEYTELADFCQGISIHAAKMRSAVYKSVR